MKKSIADLALYFKVSLYTQVHKDFRDYCYCNSVSTPHGRKSFKCQMSLWRISLAYLFFHVCCSWTMVRCSGVVSIFLNENTWCITSSQHKWTLLSFLSCAYSIHIQLRHTSASERVLLQVTQVLRMRRYNPWSCKMNITGTHSFRGTI